MLRKLPGLSGRKVTVEVGEKVWISRTAKFGPGVKIGNNVVIGPGSQIGAYTRIHDDVVIEARVVVGERVQLKDCTLADKVSVGERTRCAHAAVESEVEIGNRCFIEGRSSSAAVTIGGGTMISHFARIEGRVIIRPTPAAYGKALIGHRTEIINIYDRVLIIEYAVQIGTNCCIKAGKFGSVIGGSVRLGNDVHLNAVNLEGCVVIGSGSSVNHATIGELSRLGERVTIQPGVKVPANWLLPDGAIANSHPSSPVPVVIVRALEARM